MIYINVIQIKINCVIKDHAMKDPAQYNRFKEAMKAYTNKLMIGITTAGDNENSFCWHKLQYCLKILNKTIIDDSYFVFISRADQDEDGNCDYMVYSEALMSIRKTPMQ